MLFKCIKYRQLSIFTEYFVFVYSLQLLTNALSSSSLTIAILRDFGSRPIARPNIMIAIDGITKNKT